jgi:hypothetical protein
VDGGLQPGDALVIVCLAIVTLPPRSTPPAVAGCHLVGCSVVIRLSVHSHTAALISSTSVSAWGPFWPPMPRPRLV